MILNVRVTPKSKRNEIKKTANCLKVYLTSPADKNKANIHLIEILADYFKVRKNQITITKGLKSRDKIIEIL
ncbi:MAG: DUF167 domain-containing protein [Candidatus Omnitrophota bacterium]